MKKKELLLLLLLIIPGLFMIFIGIICLNSNIEIHDTRQTSGIIEEYYKGTSGKFKKPMHIILNNEKYIIDSGVRYSFKFQELTNIFKVGNEIEIEYIEATNVRKIIGFNYNDDTLLTKEQYIKSYNEAQKSIGISLINVGYTIILLNILFSVTSLNSKNLISRTFYLSKKELVTKILLMFICFIISIVLSLAINSWLYLIFISLSFVVSVLLMKSINKIHIMNEIEIIVKFKKIIYQWNGLKQVKISKINNRHKRMIFNFTNEPYNKYDFKKQININGKHIVKFIVNNKEYEIIDNYIKTYYRNELIK